jgi:membrane-associated phospholipid phosphatase
VIGYSSNAAGTLSDVTLGLALGVLPIADLLDVGWSEVLLEDVVVYAQAIGAASFLVETTQWATARPLPRTYAGDPNLLRKTGGYVSFFSGHTVLTVTALTTAAWTLRLRYGEQGWPWLVVALAGASVAVERVAAGQHFPTDVFVGALTGLGIGSLIPLLHARGELGGHRVSLVPAGRGLAIVAGF